MIVGHSEFFVNINFTDQNGYRSEFQVEIPVEFKTCFISSDLTMSYLAQRLTKRQISSQSVMTDFGMISGLEYAKKTLIFSRICFFFYRKVHLIFVNGKIFDNYDTNIECSIQSHKFKEVFTTFRSFWENLKTRYITNYDFKTPHALNGSI